MKPSTEAAVFFVFSSAFFAGFLVAGFFLAGAALFFVVFLAGMT
jgi:hypothetical protein